MPAFSELKVGSKVGDYVLVKLLGGGGQGQVWKARQNHGAGLECALKFLSRVSENGLRRFEREFEASKRVNHPHILPAFELKHDSQFTYIRMKLVQNGSLADHIAKRKENVKDAQRSIVPRNMEGDQWCTFVLRVIMKTCEALDALHKADLLHRDIKPSNILIDSDAHPYLADLGIVKSVRAGTIPTTGKPIGTVGYMPPEYFSPGKPLFGERKPVYNERSDIFSLGTVLYEALTTSHPLSRMTTGQNNGSVERSILKNSADISLIPECLREPIKSSLAKKPRRRCKSAEKLHAMLEHSLNSL